MKNMLAEVGLDDIGAVSNRFNALMEQTEEIDSGSSIFEGEEHLFTDHIRKSPAPSTIITSAPRVTRARNQAQEALLMEN